MDQLSGGASSHAQPGVVNGLPDAALALQASAAAARVTASQTSQAPGVARGPQTFDPRRSAPAESSTLTAAGGGKFAPAESAASLGRPPQRALVVSAGTHQPMQHAPAARTAVGNPRATAGGALGAHSASQQQGGAPSMDVVVLYQRSWSIQEALDQHSTLCRQKEILTKIGTNRVRTRRTHQQFAQMEVEDAVEKAKKASVADVCDPARTQALAANIRRVTYDLAMATRLARVDETTVREHLRIAEDEIEKSRIEMKVLKQAIDDKSLVVATDSDTPPAAVVPNDQREYFYCTNCKVGGHGQRFCEYLIKRPEWRIYPYQKWFEDEKHNEYNCPLGKRLVDFADESHFSRIAMYLKGRIWLEDKTKMWELVPELMPDTYVIEDRKWRDGRAPPPDSPDDKYPWFVKEADRNWGTSVHVCSKASECMSLAKPESLYVVQQHIRDPLCMDDGRKCHIKFYVLLMCLEDAKTWRLYTFKNGYLSISPNRWSPEDTSKETQVTIIRSERIGDWKHWPAVYPKCKAGVAEVVKRGVAGGKLEGRPSKRQFEILSSDFIVDTRGDVWLFEFNMSPVLKDPQDSPQTNDADMITQALDIVVPRPGSDPGDWDFAGEFIGEPPAPKPAANKQEQNPGTSSPRANANAAAQGSPAGASALVKAASDAPADEAADAAAAAGVAGLTAATSPKGTNAAELPQAEA